MITGPYGHYGNKGLIWSFYLDYIDIKLFRSNKSSLLETLFDKMLRSQAEDGTVSTDVELTPEVRTLYL